MVTSKKPERPAQQARSRRTEAALLDAAESLLQERAFESLSLAEIVHRAGVTTGAFYGRFTKKDDLLPALYERYLSWRTELVEEEVRSQDWSAMTLPERADRAADLACRTFERRPWLLRAMAVHARKKPEAARRARRSDGVARPQVVMLQSICDRLEDGVPAKRRMPRVDLEFLVYSVLTMAREMTLFPGLPMARHVGLGRRGRRERLAQMLLAGFGQRPSGRRVA